jgi:hypothetical protein
MEEGGVPVGNEPCKASSACDEAVRGADILYDHRADQAKLFNVGKVSVKVTKVNSLAVFDKDVGDE